MARPRSESQHWLQDQHPHDAARSAAQVQGLLEMLGRRPKRVLDLGCGIGRVLVPLCEAGHFVTGIDRDARALAHCRRSLKTIDRSATLRRCDFLETLPRLGAFDAVLCLGNTWMNVVEVEQGVEVLKGIRAHLQPRGVFFIDDFPFELWREVAEGFWMNGISDDGRQMIWSEGEPVIALRRGRRVDPKKWTIDAADRCFRLWTMGELRLAARLAGLSAPKRVADAGLLALRRPAG